MRQTSFEKFIRFGGTKTFILKTGSHPGLVFKQETVPTVDLVRAWSMVSGAEPLGRHRRAF